MQECGIVLLNISTLAIGEKYNVYSSTKGALKDEVVEIYELEKKAEGIFIKYSKNVCSNLKTSFEGLAKGVGADRFNLINTEKINLSKEEKSKLRQESIEPNLIRQGYNLVGTYDDGLSFSYPNIISVRKIA